MTFIQPSQNKIYDSLPPRSMPSTNIVIDKTNGASEKHRIEHLARRAQIEPKVLEKNESWRKKLTDPVTFLKAFLWVTRLKSWAERNALSLEHREMIFEYDDLPPAFHGFKILHLADLHIDAHPELADRLCEEIKHLEVDLCLLTGDYQFGAGKQGDMTHQYMERVFASINARGGCMGILGNHDVAADVMPMESIGIKMLLNESLEVKIGDESIWVAGVDDPFIYECDDLHSAVENIPDTAFKVLMAHSPQLYHEAADHNIHLYLCGHTHSGQIQIPGIGMIISQAKAPRKFASGTWQHQQMHGYTSAGIGVSGMVARMFCPPEIGIIELRRTGFEN